MARLVRIPEGYGKAFTYQSPGKLNVTSTQGTTKITGNDIVNFLNFAEKVGKSETVNAVAGQFLDDDGTEEASVEEAKVTEKPTEDSGLVRQPSAPMTGAPRRGPELPSETRPAEPMMGSPRRGPEQPPPVSPPAGVEPAPAAAPSPPPAAGERMPSATLERAARARYETKLAEPPLINVQLTKPYVPVPKEIPPPRPFSPPEESPEGYVVAFSEITSRYAAPKDFKDIKTADESERNLEQMKHNSLVRRALIQGLSKLSAQQVREWAELATQVEGDDPAKAQLIRNAVIGAAHLREARRQQAPEELQPKTIQAPGPAQPAAPQPPPPTPMVGPKATKAIIVDTAATGGKEVKRDVQSIEPAEVTESLSIGDFMNKYGLKKQPSAPVELAAPAETMTYQKFMEARQAPELTIPEKVTFTQLQALSKLAVTPQQKADILMAYARASGKSKPRSLVERYSRAHEQRDIDKLNSLFPTRPPPSASEEYYKYARGEKEQAAAQQAREKAGLLQQQQKLTAQRTEELRRNLDAGSPEIAAAYKMALAQEALQRGDLTDARRKQLQTFMAAEQNKIDSIALKNYAQAYKTAIDALKPKGGRGGSKGPKAPTWNQELQARVNAVKASTSELDKNIDRVRKKVQLNKTLDTQLNSLNRAIAAAGPTENVAGLRAKVAELEGKKSMLAGDPEAQESTLNGLVRQRQVIVEKHQGELDEMQRRLPAAPSAQPAVPQFKRK